MDTMYKSSEMSRRGNYDFKKMHTQTIVWTEDMDKHTTFNNFNWSITNVQEVEEATKILNSKYTT